MPGFGAFSQAPVDVLQSLNHLEALPRKNFGDFLKFTHSAFSGVDERQAEDS